MQSGQISQEFIAHARWKMTAPQIILLWYKKYSTIKAQNYKATKSIIRIKSNSITSVSESITAAILSCKVKLFRTSDLGVEVLLLKSYSLFNQMLVQLQKSQTNFPSLLFPTSTQTSCAQCVQLLHWIHFFSPLLLALNKPPQT